MSASLPPKGAFKARITLEVVRPFILKRHDEAGVTYRTASDYELAYKTVLQFSNGQELPVTARLLPDMNKHLIVRDSQGKPEKVVGYAQGRSEIRSDDGSIIFEGHYYDTRIAWPLTGDEALTPVGTFAADHWENSFGRGAYAGHAFSLAVHFTREGTAPMAGDATGQIE